MRTNRGRLGPAFALTLSVIMSLALAGCGSEAKTPSGSTTDPVVIEVTFKGDTVTPNGDRVEVAKGQPVEFRITAETAGEIHVHSSPEQEFAYEAGESTKTVTIDNPGVVEVESHDLDQVIVQLQVS